MPFRIRSSKFRHVYGSVFRRENCYENVRITRNAHDSNFCAVNPRHLAVVTESAGGGAFMVLSVDRGGRVDMTSPKVTGHTGAVLDIKWNPFNDDFIASCSEDTTVKLWQIPKSGLVTPLTDWVVDLHGHSRRVGYIEWHPTAENVLLSAGYDYKCVVWNVEQAEPITVVDVHHNNIFSISWNHNGSLFATTCKDRTLRAIDPRSATVVAETLCHRGPKAAKAVFVDNFKLATTGFSLMSERQLALWDLRNFKTAVHNVDIDSSCGVVLPYYDEDTKVIFLAGKGDGNIRYYEVSDAESCFHFLNLYQSPSPQRGLGSMPKRGCDVHRCEIARFYKLHAAKNLVEPISMIVPRKADGFQQDVFPPTASCIPSLRADEWICGLNRDPILVSLQDGSVSEAPRTTTSKAVHNQDTMLQQGPTITTYRALGSGSSGVTGQGSQKGWVEGRVERRRKENQGTSETPASIKNIKRLSMGEDLVTLSNASPASDVTQFSTVASPGAAPSTNGMPASLHNEETSAAHASSAHQSPTSLSPSLSPTASTTRTSGVPYLSQSQLVLKQHPTSPTITTTTTQLSAADSSLTSQPKKIHIRKTWHPTVTSPGGTPPPSTLHHHTQSEGRVAALTAPSGDAELKNAYFRQLEEINSLREQLKVKDKRIRQLEAELAELKGGHPVGNTGESDC